MEELSKFDNLDVVEFERRARAWVELYAATYQTKNVTPYMHIYANHVAESIKINGDINRFSQQGLEKLNDLITKWYFRGTNHKGVTALTQIIQKKNRSDVLKGCKRKLKFNVTCSVCKVPGHNATSCTEKN